MPKATGSATSHFYAVAKGHHPGLYLDWEECEYQVKGFPSSKHKKFRVREEAEAWLLMHGVQCSDTQTRSASSREPRPGPSNDSVRPRERRSASPVQRRPPHAARQTEGALTRHLVYCDGACQGNGNANSIAGVGVYWGPDDPRNISERCPGTQTNNRAELIAIIRVLETTPMDFVPILIRTDSKYSIQCVTEWLSKWRRQGFRNAKGQPVKNQPLICYIDALLHKRRRAGQQVKFEHVYGHRGEEGNEGADREATRGCALPAVQEPDWKTLEADARAPVGVGEAPLADEPAEGLRGALSEDAPLTTDHSGVDANNDFAVDSSTTVQDQCSPSPAAEPPVPEEELLALVDCLGTAEELEAELAGI